MDDKVDRALAKAKSDEEFYGSTILKMRPWGESFTGREVWEVQNMFPNSHVYADDYCLYDFDDESILWHKPLSIWNRWPVKVTHKLKGWLFYN